MKKILHVVSSLALGGTEAFIMNNYRCLDRKEYQFDFLVFNNEKYPYDDEIHSLGGKIMYACFPTINNIHKFNELFDKAIVEGGPYIAVHSHVNIANSIVLSAAKKAGIRIRVSHSHDTGLEEKNLLKILYTNYRKHIIKKSATKIVACSQIAGEYLYGKKYFNNNGIVLKNGIDVSKFIEIDEKAKNNLRKEFNINQTDMVFGNITRFEEKKNTMFTLRLFKRIIEKQPNAVLILGGPDGGLYETAQKYVKENNLSKYVRFIGERSDVNICLSLIDGYIFPSLYEGFGIVVLEAQASGCVCFCADNISKEIDVGLGLINYISIESPDMVDVQDIIDKTKKIYRGDVHEAFRKKGYSIVDTHKSLMQLYN